jgi:hypothetical protein
MPPPSIPKENSKRSSWVLLVEIFGGTVAVIAGIATTAAGGGYALERWQDTKATIDFSGDIDQKKPFSITLVIKNPSTIFSMHVPYVACWVDLQYVTLNNKSSYIAADRKPLAAGTEILPGTTRNYLCNFPDSLTVKEGGSPTVLKQADMLVRVQYETWLPWSIEREAFGRFLLLENSTGFHWIKGEWVGPDNKIAWPANAAPRPPRPEAH